MDKVTYAFFECEECATGFAVEDNVIDEPVCPACHHDMSRFVGLVDLPMPLNIRDHT